MDDLGSDELSKLSCNPKRIDGSTIFDSTNTSGNTAKEAIICTPCVVDKCNEGDKDKGRVAEEGMCVAGGIVDVATMEQQVNAISSAFSDDSDGKEKADITPENLKKMDDIISGNYGNENNCSQAGEELKIVEDESPTKQSLAFTIDFGDDSSTSVVAATKYKNIMERFQNRHKRGSSMSKLEDQTAPTTPVAMRTPRMMSTKQPRSEISEASKVKLRMRERSTSGVRDSNKRHSWSPRSSTHESFEYQKQPEKPTKSQGSTVNKTSVIGKQCKPVAVAGKMLVADSTIPERPVHKISQSGKEEINTTFTPRSTAMQIALNKIEFLCPEPPLKLKTGDDDDSVSEAGTYTLDGDNYTEEQKELMNIDKNTSLQPEIENPSLFVKDVNQIRPNDLPLLSSTSENCKRSNILEVSYYHDSTSLKPKISYLEKIKSRVKSITKSPEKKVNSPSDVGTFTSVTTSGILSKKPTLDSHPKLNRKNSLTKSQIDSSEYVSTENNLRSTGANYSNTFTDHQKAEYKLNLFTNRIDYPAESPPTPESPTSNYIKPKPPETGLKTAQTKNDWIQEWARNARARSMSATKEINDQMSRSYDCESGDTIFNNSYNIKLVDRFRNHAIGDTEYSSDPNVSARRPGNEPIISSRPPMSPSRIPSPMHSIGKARSANRMRGSLQDLSPLNTGTPETDVYLQTTAAAISNLAQSFTRKNSIKACRSPPSASNSPRRLYQQHYSADEYSPTHTEHNGHHGIHKRNLSLDYRSNTMSQSLNSEALTEILHHRSQQRPRKNSFDASADASCYRNRHGYIDQTQQPIKQPQSQSPLRRSNSFSIKPLGSTGVKSAPAVRNVPKAVMVPKNPIQKSASSNCFRKMYSDYDENIAYYINDEDDLVDDYCSSDDYEEQGEYYAPPEPNPEPEPLTNTRYNKALLMRIERSKQKVAGMTQGKPVVAGVMACPNTPEMPRRAVQNTARASMRQSVPRDSSLNRLRGEVPNSLASAKKQLLQSANTVQANKKVQPKYMDISKYKSTQGTNFLRKDETKVTLISKPEVKRSPSSASVGMNRSDPIRTSNRSVKSAGCRPNSSKRDSSVSKQKEAELAMWKRRATYDPMKAAAEGRRKQEAKKLAQVQAKCADKPPISPSRRNL